MTKLAFVCASTADKTIDSWISELAPATLQSKYDIKYLCSSPKDKILKKDIDLEMTVLDTYPFIVPVGAEALKYVCGLTGITKYNGTLVQDRFIPLMHPNIISVKPQSRDDIVKALSTISNIVNGTHQVVVNDKYHVYIDNEELFNEYYEKLEKAKEIVCDIETTGLSFMDNEIIGVAFSTKPHEGVFISINVILNNKDKLRNFFTKGNFSNGSLINSFYCVT